MANYLTTDTDLTAVADAIRTEKGITSDLVYPTDYSKYITDDNNCIVCFDGDETDDNAQLWFNAAHQFASGCLLFKYEQTIVYSMPSYAFTRSFKTKRPVYIQMLQGSSVSSMRASSVVSLTPGTTYTITTTGSMAAGSSTTYSFGWTLTDESGTVLASRAKETATSTTTLLPLRVYIVAGNNINSTPITRDGKNLITFADDITQYNLVYRNSGVRMIFGRGYSSDNPKIINAIYPLTATLAMYNSSDTILSSNTVTLTPTDGLYKLTTAFSGGSGAYTITASLIRMADSTTLASVSASYTGTGTPYAALYRVTLTP